MKYYYNFKNISQINIGNRYTKTLIFIQEPINNNIITGLFIFLRNGI